MIGNVRLDALTTAEEKWEASKANFKNAMAVAKEEFDEVKSRVDAGDPYYAVIDLKEARENDPVDQLRQRTNRFERQSDVGALIT